MGKAVATHPDTTPAERERMVLDYQHEVPEPDIVWEYNARLAILTMIREGLLAYRGEGVVQLTEAGATTRRVQLRYGAPSERGD
jgi:hypothetical protein